jgi:hypothetical protein
VGVQGARPDPTILTENERVASDGRPPSRGRSMPDKSLERSRSRAELLNCDVGDEYALRTRPNEHLSHSLGVAHTRVLRGA